MPSTVVPPPPAWARSHLASSGAAARARLASEETARPARRGARAAVAAAVALTITAVAAVCLLALGSVSAGAPPAIPAQVLAQPVQAGPGGPAPQPVPHAGAQQSPQAAAGAERVAAPDRMGNWTPELGRSVAQRALRWLGWPYSFAGGNALGPTYGVAVDAASRNDPQVRGFDCSGLVLYALAPWRALAHLASAQYVEAGTWHPALSTLQPGDLVFWSTDGTIAGVTHVAIYVGNGDVVQAPHSGATVTITPLDAIEPGSTIGTVRPLT